MRKYDNIVSVLMMVLSGAVFVGTKQYPAVVSGTIGLGVWPRFLAVLLILLSAALLVDANLIHREQADRTEEPIAFGTKGMRRAFCLFGVLAVFGILLYFMGFVIASLIFIPAAMYILGENRLQVLIPMSLITTGVVYVLFEILLKATLPKPFFM